LYGCETWPLTVREKHGAQKSVWSQGRYSNRELSSKLVTLLCLKIRSVSTVEARLLLTLAWGCRVSKQKRKCETLPGMHRIRAFSDDNDFIIYQTHQQKLFWETSVSVSEHGSYNLGHTLHVLSHGSLTRNRVAMASCFCVSLSLVLNITSISITRIQELRKNRNSNHVIWVLQYSAISNFRKDATGVSNILVAELELSILIKPKPKCVRRFDVVSSTSHSHKFSFLRFMVTLRYLGC
jgi:hypothetical protein